MAGAIPRYSVLLPTRNGGPFVAACIDSILGQAYEDFELVVADNANADGTQDVLQAYCADSRLRVVRSEKLLSVTENWTAALRASRGEYILMIGDDDLLLPDVLSELDEVVNRYQQPDCVTFNGYRYVTPNALSRDATSHYGDPYFHYDASLPPDSLVPLELRRRLVHRMFRFDFGFPLTMQLTLVRRKATRRLPHGLFKSVFPDHYAVAGLLLTAERWALVDRRLVVVGVNPKSFGQYFFNDRDQEGVEYLGSPIAFADQLQGNSVLNATYAWLQETLEDFRGELGDTEIDRGAYVARQVRYWLRQQQHGQLTAADVARHVASLGSHDLGAIVRSYCSLSGLGAVARASRTQRTCRADHFVGGLRPLPGIADIAEFATWITNPAAHRPTA